MEKSGWSELPIGYIAAPVEPNMHMIKAGLASTAAYLNMEQKFGKHVSKLQVNREKMRIRYRAMLGSLDVNPSTPHPISTAVPT